MNRPHDDFARFERLAGDVLRSRNCRFPDVAWQARVAAALSREAAVPARPDAQRLLLPLAAASLLVCAVSGLSIHGSLERLAAATTLNAWTSLLMGGQGYPF